MTAPGAPRPWAALAVPAAGVIIAAGSVVPLAVPFAGLPADGVVATWRLWGWGLLITAGVTVLLHIGSRGAVTGLVLRGWGRARRAPSARFAALVAAAFAAVALAFTLVVFEGNPRNVDGFAQLFQARIFLAGRVWLPPPPELASFGTLHMMLGPERWYAQYPPGQSAVLAAGLLAGAWWLLLPVWAAALPLLVLRVGRWVGDEGAARLAALLLCVSPFALAVAGTEMSHLPAAVLGTAAAACATAVRGRRPWLAAAGAGAMLGLMTAFRPLDALAAAVPAGVILLVTARRVPRALALAAVGGMAGTIPTLWYNAATTGSWRTFGYTALWGPNHSLGFHAVPWGIPLTPLRALGLSTGDLWQLNQYLLDVPFPMLIVAAAGLVLGRRRLAPRDAVPVAGLLSLVGLLFFYWHRDVFYGPRFLYSALPWIVLLVARGVALLVRESGDRPGLRTVPAGLLVGVAVGAALLTPDRIAAYRASTPTLNLHPDRAVAAAGITDAVVLIPDGWGSRLIARMWEAGVPVRESTRLYGLIDACTLEQVLDSASVDPALRARITGVLTMVAARGRPGVRAGLTEDPALRLPPGVPLPPACTAELAFDQSGFVSYAPFLYHNDASLRGPVIYARDLRDRNGPLRRRYPDRRFYRFAPPGRGAPPVLTPLADAPAR